ncbi:MAG: tol-pal system protein YbgF [Myxococcales bacterium]|nr:tol-pal system protein YbgF [Myxococcales bacterium]
MGLYDFMAVMRKAILTIVAMRAIVLPLGGCATPMSAVREDNHRLTRSMTELRTDRRAQDRKIRDLEHQLAMLREKTAGETAMPQLPVEVVAPPGASLPEGQRVVGIADDGSEIIYEGDAATGKPATIEDDSPVVTASTRPRARAPELQRDVPVVAASDRIEVTRHVPPVSARPMRTRGRVEAPASPPSSDAAAVEYRAAVELVRGGKYEDSIVALRGFLEHFPRHDYADNAQYWLGEAFYAQKDYPHALIEFRATIETYPRGNKVPDALLKVGYCYQALGKTDKARAVLEQVVNLYPKTEPAALAAKRLELP